MIELLACIKSAVTTTVVLVRSFDIGLVDVKERTFFNVRVGAFINKNLLLVF